MKAITIRLTTVTVVFSLLSVGFLMLAVKDVMAASDYTFGTENVNAGTSLNPTNKNIEDGNFNQLIEGDQYADTNFSGSSEDVTYGTAGGGSFPSSLDSDDTTRRSYTEEDTAGAPPSDYFVYLFPTADYSVNWDVVYPSGDHYAQVDEPNHDSSTTYVKTSTNNDHDYFTMADMSDPGGSYDINVTIFAVHMKDASQGASFCAGITISGTDYDGIDVNPSNGVWTNSSSTAWLTNPYTTAEWTYTDVNNMMAHIDTTDATPSVYCTQVGLMIEVTFTGGASNYELDAAITYSSVESTAQTTGYKVFCQGYRSGSENFGVYAWDYNLETWNLKDTIEDASDTDYDFTLTTDEHDDVGDEVKIRILGLTESGDTEQSVVYLDVLKVMQIREGYSLDVELTATSVPAYGNITLRIKGYVDSETMQVDVYNYTSAGYDTNKLQITDLGNAWQTTIDLCDDHHRSGTNVKVRFVDTTAAASDTTKDSLYLDVVWVTLYYSDPIISDYTTTNIEITEGEGAEVWCTYTDYDNQAPSYVRVHTNASYYAMNANDSDTDYYDGKLYGYTITGLSVGWYYYYFAVDDAESSEVTTPTTSYTITVTAVENNAPTFTSTPTATGHNNTLYYYDANAEDLDEDPLTFDLEGSITAWAAITPSTGVVQGTPDTIGDYWMNVSVTDGTATVWQNTSIHIYTDSPSFVSSAITTWQNGTTYQYNAQATDPEAEGLSFDLEGNGTSFVGITPAGYYCMLEGGITEMGWWYLNLSVTDGTNTVWQNFTLTALNSAPYFTFTPVLEGVVNISYACPISATDNNSDELIYSIDASSIETLAWLTLNLTSTQLEGVPTINGSFDVNLSVTDAVGAVSWVNFTITVDLNDADTFQVLKLIVALVFCFALFFAGFKMRLFWILAGFVWIICGLTIFWEFGDEFFAVGAGLGFVLLIMGALGYAEHR